MSDLFAYLKLVAKTYPWTVTSRSVDTTGSVDEIMASNHCYSIIRTVQVLLDICLIHCGIDGKKVYDHSHFDRFTLCNSLMEVTRRYSSRVVVERLI